MVRADLTTSERNKDEMKTKATEVVKLYVDILGCKEIQHAHTHVHAHTAQAYANNVIHIYSNISSTVYTVYEGYVTGILTTYQIHQC